MGTRYIVGELTTGRRIISLPVLTGTWSDDLDTPESVSATVKLNNQLIRTLDLRNSATVAKTFLAAIDTGAFGQDGKILAAGPIWSVNYDRAAQTLELTARGIGSIFDHRFILPPTARTTAVTAWTIPDPADPAGVGTIPNPAVATVLSGMSLGGIAVSIVAQALSWPGGSLPIVLPAVEAGTATRTWQGAEFKTVGSALTDLTDVLGGPEINFYAEFNPADPTAVRWVMQVGTTAQPLLYSSNVSKWNVTAKDSPVKALTVSSDGSGMASLSWAVAGRQADTVLISRAESTALTGVGYPLMETIDSTHSDVSQQSTLDAYAAANLSYASAAQEVWAFTVKAHPIDPDGNNAGPQLDDYNVGDFMYLNIAPYDDETNLGDLYMPEGGNIPLRIIGLSGDQLGEDVAIKCAPVVG